jgi:hypothetical protein
MQLDDQGRVAHGDLAQVESYLGFGAGVLAVADGKVVDTLNTLPEQVPPNLPDPKTIKLQRLGKPRDSPSAIPTSRSVSSLHGDRRFSSLMGG